jgi:hypothetical protein
MAPAFAMDLQSATGLRAARVSYLRMCPSFVPAIRWVAEGPCVDEERYESDVTWTGSRRLRLSFGTLVSL